jgi:hypothetical protein
MLAACHSTVYKRTFAGLVAVLLALQWSDYLPSGAPFILLVGYLRSTATTMMKTADTARRN